MEKINSLVEIMLGNNRRQSESALVDLQDEVKNATTSLTSIPKPLKFINPHYKSIVDFYKKLDSFNE